MPFKKGVSGNPSGSGFHQHRLYKKFFIDAYAAWKEHGADALERMARDDPSNFCKLMVAAMPKSINFEGEIKETKVVQLSVVLSELNELTDKLGIDMIKQLPHNKVIEHEGDK